MTQNAKEPEREYSEQCFLREHSHMYVRKTSSPLFIHGSVGGKGGAVKQTEFDEQFERCFCSYE